jgi:ketosteroid isomerase-like protein
MSANTLSAPQLLELFQKAYNGFMEGNLSPLFEILSPDVVWACSADPTSAFHGIFEGVAGVQRYFESTAHVKLEKFDLRTMMAKDNFVVALVDVRHTGHEGGLVTDGQSVHVLEFEGDKVVRYCLYEYNADK